MNLKQRSFYITRLLAVVFAGNSSMVLAGEAALGDSFNKRFTLRLSGFQASTATDIQVNSKDGVVGEEISFEDDLGLSDRETQPLLDITYRFNPKHMVDFSYVNLSRSGTKVFERSGVTTENIEWVAGTELSGSFDSEVYRISYGYSFINDGKKELGMLLGLHVTRMNISLSGRGNLVAIDPATGDEVVIEGEADRSYDSGFTIPLPVIGLHGAYAFTDQLRVRGWGQLFSLSYEDYDGSLTNAAGMLEYDITDNLGLGAGYAFYRYNLDAEGSDYVGSFNYEFKGPTLFVYASF